MKLRKIFGTMLLTLAFSSAAQAESVIIPINSISGSFSSSGPTVTSITQASTNSNGYNAVTLEYAAPSVIPIDMVFTTDPIQNNPDYITSTAPLNDLGSFTLTRIATGPSNINVASNFYLSFMVESPFGFGTSQALVTGQLQRDKDDKITSITFQPLVLPSPVIAGDPYMTIQINAIFFSEPDAQNGPATFNVTGTATLNNASSGADGVGTPLPPTATAGLALLGSLGLAQVVRRRKLCC